MNTNKNKGQPLGNPAYRSHGDARPEGAGDEGGLGFIGDQRGASEDELPSLDVDVREGEPMRPSTKNEDDKSG